MGKNTSGLKRGGPGRPRGTLNKVTTEVRAAAAALVDDPIYRRKLLHDMRKRRVLPAVETMLWFYAKGKPVERHEIATPGDFSKLSDEELLAQFEKTVVSLRAAGSLSSSFGDSTPSTVSREIAPEDVMGLGPECS